MDHQWHHNSQWGPWNGHPDYNNGFFSEDLEFSRAYHSDRVSYRKDHSNAGRNNSRWGVGPRDGAEPRNRREVMRDGFVGNSTSACDTNQKEHSARRGPNDASNAGMRPLFSMVVGRGRGTRFNESRDFNHQDSRHQNYRFGKPPQNGLLGRPPHNGLLGRPPLNSPHGRPPQSGPLGRPPQSGLLGRPPLNSPYGRPHNGQLGRESSSSWEEDEGNEISHWLQDNKDKLPSAERDPNPSKDPLPGSEEERNNTLKKATELLKQSLKNKMSVNVNELLTGDQADRSIHTDSHPVSKVLGQPKNLAELELNENDMRLIGRAQPAKASIVEEENSNDSDDIIEVTRSPSPLRDVIDIDISPVKSSDPNSNLEESSNNSDSCNFPSTPDKKEPKFSLGDALSDVQVNIRTEKPSSPSDQDKNGYPTASIIAETSSAGAILCTPSLPHNSSSTCSTVLDAIFETVKSEEISGQEIKIPNEIIKDSHTVPSSPKEGLELGVASSSSHIVSKSPKHSFKSPPPNVNQRRRRSSSLCVSPSQGNRSSPAVTSNVSRQNRIISDLKKINQTKLRDLINNPRCGKLDFAMQQLIKEHRAVISQKSRESAEKMIPAQNLTPKPDIVPDERSVLADLSIDWNSLPTELIDTLGDLFNIEGVSTLLPSEVQDAEAALLESNDLECQSLLPMEAQDAEAESSDLNRSIHVKDDPIKIDLNSSIHVKDDPIKIENRCEVTTPTVIPSSDVQLNEQTPVRIRVAKFARGNFVEPEVEERPDLSNQVESAELSDKIISHDSIENSELSAPLVNMTFEESSDITFNTIPASESVDSTADTCGKSGTFNKELPQQKNLKKKNKKKNKSKNLVRLEERSWFENASPSSSPIVKSSAGTSDPVCSSSFNSQESINNVNEILRNEDVIPCNESEILCENSIPSMLLNEISNNENELSENENQVPNNVNEVPSNVNHSSNSVDRISSNNQTAIIMPIMCMTVPANINRTIVDKMTATEIENRIKEIDELLQSLVQEKCLLHDTLNNMKSGVEQSENNQQNSLQRSEEIGEIVELPLKTREKPKENRAEVQLPPLNRKNRNNLEVNEEGVELLPSEKDNASRTNCEESEHIVAQPARKRKLTGAPDGQNSKKSKREEKIRKDSDDSSVRKSVQNVQRFSPNKNLSTGKKSINSLPSNSSTLSEKKKKSKESPKKKKKSVPVQNDISSGRNIADSCENVLSRQNNAVGEKNVSPAPRQKMEGFILCIKILKTSYLAASQSGVVYHLKVEDNSAFASYGEKSRHGVNCIEVMEEKQSYVLFTGGEDGFLRVFNILPNNSETKYNIKPIKNLNVHDSISCLAYNWGTVFVGTKSGCIMPYNVGDGKLKDSLSLGGNGVLSLLTIKEGPRKVIIVGSRHRPITVRDAESGLLLREMGTSSWSVYSLSFYNNMLFCGADQDNVAVFDFQSGKQRFKLSTGKGIINIVQSADVLFCACYDGNIYVFDLQGQQGITTIKGPGKMILCIAVFDKKLYCSSKMSETLMVTDINESIASVMIKNSQNKVVT